MFLLKNRGTSELGAYKIMLLTTKINMWKTFFRTLNKSVLICAIVCGFHAFCMDIWLFHIEAPCNIFVACGKLLYGFDLSFVAAYIFYLMTVHYPDIKNKKTIYIASDFLAMAIVKNIEGIFIDMAKKLNQDVECKNLTPERIKQILLSTSCFASSTLSNFKHSNGRVEVISKNWIEYIRNKENVWRSFMAELRPLYSHLDTEYISALADIDQYNFANPITAMVTIYISQNGQNNSSIPFSNGLEKFFLDIYAKSQTLRKIIEKRRVVYGYISDDSNKL